MNKPNVTQLIGVTRTFVTKHSPEILTGLGIASMVTSVCITAKVTPKALRLIEDAEHEKGEPLTKPEKVKAAWKVYVPVAVTVGLGTACLIGSNSVSGKRNAALATAYQLSTTALSEYKEKVIETIGEKKEKVIREKVAQKKVDETSSNNSEVIVIGNGTTKFLEPVSKRYFTGDLENIKRIVNDLNYRMITGMEEYISLSEFYDEIGLDRTSVSDHLGWNIGSDGQIEIHYRACTDNAGLPCLVLDYQVEPRYDYAKLM